MAMSDRRRRLLEGRRQKILDGARHLFREYGYQGITMQDIADAVELSKGSLYLQFRNKEDLVLALVLRSFDRLEKVMEAEVAKSGNARERLERLARAYMAYAIENRGTRDAFLLTVSRRPDLGSEYQGAVRKRIDRLYGIVATIFDDGSKDGSLRPDIESVDIIRLFAVGMEVFGERLSRLGSVVTPTLAADEESLSKRYIELFIYFISPAAQGRRRSSPSKLS